MFYSEKMKRETKKETGADLSIDMQIRQLIAPDLQHKHTPSQLQTHTHRYPQNIKLLGKKQQLRGPSANKETNKETGNGSQLHTGHTVCHSRLGSPYPGVGCLLIRHTEQPVVYTVCWNRPYRQNVVFRPSVQHAILSHEIRHH